MQLKKKKKKMGIIVFPKSINMLILVLFFICIKLVTVEAQSPHLAGEEVEALREIATQLGKRDCGTSAKTHDSMAPVGLPQHLLNADRPLYNNTVTSNCSYVLSGVCHVTSSIFFKGQDLAGVLPPSIAKLPYLTAV